MTFDRVINVEVTWNQWIFQFFNDDWQWLWTALMVPIGGWLWKRKKGSKPETSQHDG